MRRAIALAVLMTALAPSAAHAETEPGSGLVSYGIRANAPGLGIEGLYRDVALTVPETTSTLSTGGVGAGIATIAWPGPIVGNLGTTILVLQSSAPPQVTALNDPVRAEARSGGQQKSSFTSLPGTVMTSTATREKVTSSSQTGSSSLPIGSVGAFSGATTAALSGTTTVTSTASSLMSDLSLAGGVLKIGSVSSKAEATTDGIRSKASGSTLVGGVTLAGMPVAIDDKGIHLAGTTAANPITQEALNQAIAALGLSVVLTQPRTVRQAGVVSYDAGALVLLYDQGANHYALTLGRASVSLAAGRGDAAVQLPPLPPLPQPTLPTSMPRTDTPLPAVNGSSGGVIGAPDTPAPSVDGPVGQVVQAVSAAAVSLASGASGALTLALIALGGLLVLAMKRLPDRVLVDDAADCDEWPS